MIINRAGPSVNPFARCPDCDAVIVPGFGRWRDLDLDGEPHNCRQVDSGQRLQACAECDFQVWTDPDGRRWERHRCPGRHTVSLPPPAALPIPGHEQLTGDTPLSELEALVREDESTGHREAT